MAEMLSVTQASISTRLKAMGQIQKKKCFSGIDYKTNVDCILHHSCLFISFESHKE